MKHFSYFRPIWLQRLHARRHLAQCMDVTNRMFAQMREHPMDDLARERLFREVTGEQGRLQ